MKEALKALQSYNIQGAVGKIAPFGSGHINDTFLVETDRKQYLFQRLNQHVFQHPDKVEGNVKSLLKGNSDLFVKHYLTQCGNYHGNGQGVWRLTDFVDDAYAPLTADNLSEVVEASKGFGRFTLYANGLDANQFEETISQFHDLNSRLKQLNSALENGIPERLNKAEGLISQANSFKWISTKMETLIAKGLPVRVCHNDTKLDNCLLSKADYSFKHIIDLDTLGPGYVLFDFGDLMRTTVSPTKENELDQEKIQIRKSFIEGLKDAFLSECEAILKEVEKENLMFGGLYMTYIMAIRFLTDYLNGDVYYKTSFESENFIRARNQFRLLQLIHSTVSDQS